MRGETFERHISKQNDDINRLASPTLSMSGLSCYSIVNVCVLFGPVGFYTTRTRDTPSAVCYSEITESVQSFRVKFEGLKLARQKCVY